MPRDRKLVPCDVGNDEFENLFCKKIYLLLSDEKDLTICEKGEIIKHGDVKAIPGEGMPTYKNPFEKGYLILQFIVHFPPANFIPHAKANELEKLLPPRHQPIIADGAEECILVEMDPSKDNPRGGHGHNAHHAYYQDDDDDMDGHPRGVQCQSQ